MADRFFIDSPWIDDELTLADDQAHHLLNVMRATLGQPVVLFDRDGNEFKTEIIGVEKKRLTLKRIETFRPQRKLAADVTIAAALPKGDRQKFLIEKLVELGVTTYIPLTTPRSVAQVNEKVLKRIEKQIIEATKQCRRSYLMEVDPAATLAEIIAAHDGDDSRCYLAHPYDAVAIESLPNQPDDANRKCVWLIGPEGGFSDAEVAQATEAGWQAVSFGEIILRVETAAMVAAMQSRSLPALSAPALSAPASRPSNPPAV